MSFSFTVMVNGEDYGSEIEESLRNINSVIQSGGGMNIKQLIDEVTSLPIEERGLVVDSLLKSMNQVEDEIDKEWGRLANKRLLEIRSGQTQAIPGELVFQRIWEKYGK